MKLRATAILIAIVAVLLCGFIMPAGVAYADSNPVLLLSGKMQGDEVVVTVTLRDNEGISGMTLNLEYDTDKIVLTGYDKGTALSTLDLMTTNSQGAQGYAIYPFSFFWLGDANDSSNGVLLTLHFAVKEGAQGEARVTFNFVQGQDVVYLVDGDSDPKTRNLLCDSMLINLSGGQATAFTSEKSYLYNNSSSSLSKQEQEEKKAITIGLSVGVPIVVAIVILVPLFIVRKRNNN